MLGMPGSKYEDDLKTIEFAKEIDPDWAQFTITTPYPGTQLYQELLENGKLDSQKWDSYQTWGGFSEELKTLQRKALKSFYFRPKVILRKLTSIDNLPIFRKYILGAFALLAGGSGRPPE